MLSLCVIPESYRLPQACGTSERVFFTVLFCGNYGSKTNEDCLSVKSLIWEISSGCRELRVGMHPWAHRLRVI